MTSRSAVPDTITRAASTRLVAATARHCIHLVTSVITISTMSIRSKVLLANVFSYLAARHR
jgi:hypothetical protein